MNPWGLLVIMLGVVVFIIGFKGSQHDVIAEFKSAGSTAKAAKA